MTNNINNTMNKVNTAILGCFLVTLVSFLGGCATTVNTAPEKTYYVLPENSTTRDYSGTPKISIRYVKLPSYLNQQGIVRQLPNGQVNVSYTDLWAEKLSHSIPTILSEALAQDIRQPIETHPLSPGIKVNKIIEVNINKLIGNAQELALSAKYRVVTPHKLTSYHFKTRVSLTNTNTKTLVNAHTQAITLLANDIAQKLYQ